MKIVIVMILIATTTGRKDNGINCIILGYNLLVIIKNVLYDTNIINMVENLDNEWIKDFEKTFKLYEDFYKDDVYFTNIHCIYINKHNNIEKISEDRFLFNTPNLISREEILRILKQNTCYNNKQYSILSILKFVVNLEPEEIKDFLKNDINNENENSNFLQIIKNIDSIHFEKSINMFHDLNDLFFIFYEKTVSNNNNSTRKIYLKNSVKNNSITIDNNNNIKKHNKTLKK